MASRVGSILLWEAKPGGGALLGIKNPGGVETWALETITWHSIGPRSGKCLDL